MQPKRPMIFVISFVVMVLLVMIIGKISLSIQFNKQVTELFSNSRKDSVKTYTQELLTGLPEPVQRYFKYVLREGQHKITTVRFKHDGQFKTGAEKSWVAIKGEQYVTTETPGFIWKGTTTLFTARDLYIADKGRLTVSLFSVIKVVDAKGKNYDQGELLRWLGESVLYPTNLLPGERL